MIKYFQESKLRKNVFCECEKSQATHFIGNGFVGHRPISDLRTTNVISGFQPNTQEPLELPTLNFGIDEEENNDDNVLELPKTF